MQTRLKLRPGQRGTRKLHAEYGRRLVCVRYRYDEIGKKRYKTVEIIVDEIDWHPRLKPDTVVKVRGQWNEPALTRRIKEAGGVWNKKQQVWELRYDCVVALGLKDRMVGIEGI